MGSVGKNEGVTEANSVKDQLYYGEELDKKSSGKKKIEVSKELITMKDIRDIISTLNRDLSRQELQEVKDRYEELKRRSNSNEFKNELKQIARYLKNR